MVIVLDTFPTSCVSKRPGTTISTVSERCRIWIDMCEAAGHRVLVPEICYYESLRELEQRRAMSQIARLKAFCLDPERFVPLSTVQIDKAAELWGWSRRAGLPTADPQALDADVILAAQVLALGIEPPGLIIATTNPVHISRFVAAELWTNIEVLNGQ